MFIIRGKVPSCESERERENVCICVYVYLLGCNAQGLSYIYVCVPLLNVLKAKLHPSQSTSPLSVRCNWLEFPYDTNLHISHEYRYGRDHSLICSYCVLRRVPFLLLPVSYLFNLDCSCFHYRVACKLICQDKLQSCCENIVGGHHFGNASADQAVQSSNMPHGSVDWQPCGSLAHDLKI